MLAGHLYGLLPHGVDKSKISLTDSYGQESVVLRNDYAALQSVTEQVRSLFRPSSRSPLAAHRSPLPTPHSPPLLISAHTLRFCQFLCTVP